MNNDEDLVQFCEITGSIPEIAQQYLTVTDGSLETAIQMYLENGGMNLNPTPTPSITNTSTHIQDDSNHLGFRSFSPTQLVDSPPIQLRSFHPSQPFQNVDPSPSPVPIQSPIVIDDSDLDYESDQTSIKSTPDIVEIVASPPNNTNTDISNSNEREQRNRNERRASEREALRNQRDIRSPFNYQRVTERDVRAAQLQERSNLATQEFFTEFDRPLHDSTLQEISTMMFKPPTELVFKGSFENARQTAKTQNKHILVNVFDSTLFCCQALNRDLWSDPTKEYIKENLLFLYLSKNSQQGINHSTYYPNEIYPYICLIDSITGERLKVWNYQITANDLLQEIIACIDKSVEPVHPVDQLSEEEQIKIALQASIDDHVPDHVPVDDSRIVIKRLKTDTVRTIYEELKYQVSGRFELRCFRENLITKLDQSIEDAQLVNGTINLDLE